jgi:PhnB protein
LRINCPATDGSFVAHLNPKTIIDFETRKRKMSNPVKPIPEGSHALTPHLVVKGASQAIEFYKKAFGAEEIMRMPGPDGRSIIHAQLKIGGLGPLSIGGTPVTIHLFVEDVDTVFNRAVAAGAQVNMPLENAFWGDRYGRITDPFGHSWSLATHKEDLTPEEISKRAQAGCAGSAGPA